MNLAQLVKTSFQSQIKRKLASLTINAKLFLYQLAKIFVCKITTFVDNTDNFFSCFFLSHKTFRVTFEDNKS